MCKHKKIIKKKPVSTNINNKNNTHFVLPFSFFNTCSKSFVKIEQLILYLEQQVKIMKKEGQAFISSIRASNLGW